MIAAALAVASCLDDVAALFPCQDAPACSCGPGEQGTAWCRRNGTFDRCICQPGETPDVDADGDVAPDSAADVTSDPGSDAPGDALADPPAEPPSDAVSDPTADGAEDPSGDADDSAGEISDSVSEDAGDLASDTGAACQQIVSDPLDDGAINPCWQSLTIGEGLPGSATETSSLLVTADGADIYSAGDEFFFVYQHACGDIDLTLTVNYVPDVNPWSKAGLMIRENLTPASLYAAIFATDGNGYDFQLRSDAFRRPDQAEGGSYLNAPGNPDPGHLRLVRAGALFTAYYSSDGVAWTQLGDSLSLDMHPCPYIGIATTAHTIDSVGTASYNDFAVLSGGGGQ